MADNLPKTRLIHEILADEVNTLDLAKANVTHADQHHWDGADPLTAVDVAAEPSLGTVGSAGTYGVEETALGVHGLKAITEADISDFGSYVKTDGSTDIDYSTGSQKIGDVTNGNYVEIEADGTIKLVGDATAWDDIRVTPAGFDRAGVADPSLVAYQPSGSGIATYLYEFQKNDIAYFTIQLPHSYKLGTDLRAHVHWTAGANGVTENGNTVGWKIDYSWANIDGTFGAMATVDLSDACDGTNHKHQMTPNVAITGTDKGISSMLICNIKRTDTGTDDTWSRTASGSLPMLLEIDFHYEIDTFGSRETASK